MKVTTTSFDLRAWRRRMGLTQVRAAEELGMSTGGYIASEYRNEDRPNHPCNKTVALLAAKLEQERRHSEAKVPHRARM